MRLSWTFWRRRSCGAFLMGTRRRRIFHRLRRGPFLSRHGARRANLQEKLLVESGKPALVLPQIRPIGDLDEDVLEAQRPIIGLPDAISDIGREFALLALIDVWVRKIPSFASRRNSRGATTNPVPGHKPCGVDRCHGNRGDFPRPPAGSLFD